MTALRGRAFRADLGHGAKPWVIISNNSRNRTLETVLAARITTTGRNAHIPTVVPLSAADPVIGFVLVDDIAQIYHDELADDLGALSPITMQRISTALRIALP